MNGLKWDRLLAWSLSNEQTILFKRRHDLGHIQWKSCFKIHDRRLKESPLWTKLHVIVVGIEIRSDKSSTRSSVSNVRWSSNVSDFPNLVSNQHNKPVQMYLYDFRDFEITNLSNDLR